LGGTTDGHNDLWHGEAVAEQSTSVSTITTEQAVEHVCREGEVAVGGGTVAEDEQRATAAVLVEVGFGGDGGAGGGDGDEEWDVVVCLLQQQRDEAGGALGPRAPPAAWRGWQTGRG
jgi:hypothetical protein